MTNLVHPYILKTTVFADHVPTLLCHFAHPTTTALLNFHLQNSFWLSLGMSGLFFIPVIILSVITSNYYRRQKSNTAAYFMDDPYSDYLMENL